MIDITTSNLKLVAKTALIDETGKVLVLTRSDTDPTRPGGLDFPGGEIEHGEDVLAGACREIFEETGVQLAPDTLQMIYTSTSDKETDNKVILRFLYLAKVSQNSPIKLSYEHSNYEWMALERVLETFGSVSWATGLRFAVKNALISNNNLQ